MAEGIWTVSPQFLHDMFLLPEGITIRDVVVTPTDRLNQQLSILISSDEIPKQPEGSHLPYVSIWYKSEHNSTKFDSMKIL